MTPVPAGLAHLFAVIREDDETQSSPALHAARVLPHANRIVDDVHTDNFTPLTELLGAVANVFPGLDSAPEPSTVALSSFYVGVAVAWLLLAAVNGQDVPR